MDTVGLVEYEDVAKFAEAFDPSYDFNMDGDVIGGIFTEISIYKGKITIGLWGRVKEPFDRRVIRAFAKANNTKHFIVRDIYANTYM